MTITLYLQKESLLKDLKTLHLIFATEGLKSIEELSKKMPIVSVSYSKSILNNVSIQVSPLELSLIGMFNLRNQKELLDSGDKQIIKRPNTSWSF